MGHTQIRKTGEENQRSERKLKHELEGRLNSMWGSAICCVFLGKLLNLSLPVYSSQRGNVIEPAAVVRINWVTIGQAISTVPGTQAVLNECCLLLLLLLQEKVFSGACSDMFGVLNGNAELENIPADLWNVSGPPLDEEAGYGHSRQPKNNKYTFKWIKMLSYTSLLPQNRCRKTGVKKLVLNLA